MNRIDETLAHNLAYGGLLQGYNDQERATIKANLLKNQSSLWHEAHLVKGGTAETCQCYLCNSARKTQQKSSNPRKEPS